MCSSDWPSPIATGYRRLPALVRRESGAANHKRVQRLMRTDNLLCLRRRAFVRATTDSRHRWRVVPNLTPGMALTGLDHGVVGLPGHAHGAWRLVVLSAHVLGHFRYPRSP